MTNMLRQFKYLYLMVILLAAMFIMPSGAHAVNRVVMEDQDVRIVSKMGPQYLGYRVYAGSTGTTNVYYKVTAVVTGFGETGAASLTVSEANAVMSSTNSLQLLWNSVVGATSYNLYRSTVSASTYFYLLTNTAANVRSWVDDDAYTTTEGAAYAAATLPGGNLYVDNDITAGDDLVVGDDATITGDLAVTGTITGTGAVSGPLAVYTLAEMNAATIAANTLIAISNGTQESVCKSTGTRGGFVGVSSSTVHCQ